MLIHLIKKTRKTPKVQELLIKLMGITITIDDSLNEMLDTETVPSLESGSDYDPNTNLPRGFQEKAKFHYSENSRESEYAVLRQEISDICAKCTEAREERDTAIRQLEECKGISGKKFHYIISIFSKEHVGSQLLKISLEYPLRADGSLSKYLQAYHSFNPFHQSFEVMLLSNIEDVTPQEKAGLQQ